MKALTERSWLARTLVLVTLLGGIQPLFAAGMAIRMDPPSQDPCDVMKYYFPFGSRDPADDCGQASGLSSASGVVQWGPADETQPFFSSCWHGYTHAATRHDTYSPVVLHQGVPTGFRLNFGLLASPGLGDFLPVASTIGDDTLALLPPGANGHPTGWQGAGRPTLHGVVDLVTGAPLAKVTDLEIPFDGATFRLIRTRSSTLKWQRLNSAYMLSGRDAWWDWTGLGWMASENPILLIDSALPDIVGDHPRTCWLVLDAHRSIPFQLIENEDRYEAPPRFRAKMEHNGVGSQPATEYYVDLYDGEVRYTFAAIREDVPPNRWNEEAVLGENPYAEPVESSYHDRPFTPRQFELASEARPLHDPFSYSDNPGLGIPYYGICTKIEDRSGHTVEIEYCNSPRAPMDNPQSDCLECRQNCLAKGQIRSVRLKSQGVTMWTLLYAHRMFKGPELASDSEGILGYLATEFGDQNPANAPVWEMHGDIAIDRIYVFEGDPWQGTSVPCLTINHYEDPGLHGGDDPIEAYNGLHGPGAISTDWQQSVRYHYGHHHSDVDRRIPHLVRTSVITKQAEAGLEPLSTYTLYVYPSMSGSVIDEKLPWLEAIFTEEDVARLLSEQADDSRMPDWMSADAIALWRNPAQPSTSLEEHEAEPLIYQYASVRWAQPSESIWGVWYNVDAPPGEVLFDLENRYLGTAVSAEELYSDRQAGAAWLLTVKKPNGHHCYKINRLIRSPMGGSSGHLTTPLENGYCEAPHRSVYHHPYGWTMYKRGCQADVAPAPMQLPRWITIIDEVASYEQLIDEANNYDIDTGLCDGLLSRRVVEMNPSGYVLRDRTWTYLDGETIVTGGGLGVQHIYETVEEYFEGGEFELPAAEEDVVSPPQVPIDPQFPSRDPYASIRRELLFVERRSVGWSAGEETPGQSPGLLEFFEYTMLGDESDPNDPATQLPWSQRIPLVAEGIKRGSEEAANTPRLYTRQYFPQPVIGARTEECRVEFLEPVQLPLAQAPSWEQFSQSVPQDYRATFVITNRVNPDPSADPPIPPMRWRATNRMVIGVPRQIAPGSEWFFPVEAEFYDESGSPAWSATALLQDPMQPDPDPGSGDSVVMTYFDRDESGRSRHTVADATAGHIIASPDLDLVDPSVVGAWPEMDNVTWQRIPAANALNYTTSFAYDPLFGLTDTFFPNGRRWARRIIVVPDPEHVEGDPPVPAPLIARELIFNDLELFDDPPGEPRWWKTQTPGEMKDYASPRPTGIPRRTRRMEFISELRLHGGFVQTYYDGIANQAGNVEAEYAELSRVVLTPDSTGRLANAELLERNSDGQMQQVGTKRVNDLGEVLREEEMDGTITRTTRSAIGQTLRRYVGTVDWGASQGTPNLVLLDRSEYGVGVNDAWMPTISRRYESHPAWADNPYDESLADAADGIATVTSYDWRMRPVRIDSYGKGNPHASTTPRLSTTLTYLDHLDRPVLVVGFGAGAPAIDEMPPDLDPTALDDDGFWPNIPAMVREFYDITPRPTSIVTTTYGPDGTANERRMYDVAWDPPSGGGGDPPFHLELTYNGRGGAEVFAQRPGQPVMIKKLDGVGRVESSMSVLPGRGQGVYSYQIARTDYVYDGDGNTVETIRWERAIEDSADELTVANAVRTRTVSWFDAQKRLRATADLGTEQAAFVSGTYAYQHSPTVRPTTTDPFGGMPPNAQIWLYDYDKRGNQNKTTAPGGFVTEMVYTGTGRLVSRIENASDANGYMHRRVDYDYQWGRLISMEAWPLKQMQSGLGQLTRVEYGADILDADFNIVSRNKGLIGRMLMPNEDGTTDHTQPWITLRYNFAGAVAERIDARGLVQRYEYDDQGRLSEVFIGHYIAGQGGGSTPPPDVFQHAYPAGMNPPTGAPVDRIAYVKYEYDSRGNLTDVTARGPPPTPIGHPENGVLITHNRYDYDQRGALAGEWQSHGKNVYSGSSHIIYEWEYGATGDPTTDPDLVGHHRLKYITYPTQPGFSVDRELTFNYGSPGSTSEALSRIVSILTNLGTSPIAELDYVGIGRRVGIELADGKIGHNAQPTTINGVAGFEGLDTFGRIKDLHYQNTAGTPATLFRGQYTFDKSGNRATARLTQAPVGTGSGSSRDNTHSQLNRYDALQRLIGTDVGVLQAASGGGLEIDPQSIVRADAWQLDLLGNWIGGAESGNLGVPSMPGGSGAPTPPTGVPDEGGRITWGQLDAGIPGQTPGSSPLFATWAHAVNMQNEIRAVSTVAGEAANPPSTADIKFVRRDANGNLICDGTYYYQYDAWNRLLQISRAVITATSPGTPGSGEPEPLEGELSFTAEPGALVKHYTYDGLGRLIRTQSPWPNIDDGALTGEVRSERFYYDGIRRIQEVVTDPLLSIGLAMSGEGGGELQQIAEEAGEAEEVDSKAATLGLEEGQNALQGGGSPAPVIYTYVAREYVWGTGDGHAGPDELLVQYGPTRAAWWTLQDAGGDVVAVCDLSGSGGTARVCGQWRYDAYGAATAAEHLHAFPTVRCGHKALFFDRLDSASADSLGSEPPRLIPFAHLVVQMRNRAYMPQLGRFLQPDPNATALTLIEATSFHGRGMGGVGALVAVFSMMSLYDDGSNLYQYVRSNPWKRSDPLGLESGEGEEDGLNWFEEGMDAFALLDPLPGPSDFIREAARALVEDYSSNLEWDVEWALDWDMGDDEYTRLDDTWVVSALGRGMRDAFDIGLPGTDDSWNPINSVAGSNGGRGRNGRPDLIAKPGPYKHGRGPYGHLKDPPGVGKGKAFTRAQRASILEANRKRNGGKLVDDVTGKPLIEGGRGPNAAVIDHIRPKASGGTNSYRNAQVVASPWNSSKRNRFRGRRPKNRLQQRKGRVPCHEEGEQVSLPTPRQLQLRWRVFELASDLFAYRFGSRPSSSAFVSNGFRGFYTAHGDAWCWLAYTEGRSVLAGWWGQSPEAPRAIASERRVLQTIASMGAVRTVCPPAIKKSLGLTFAMRAESPDGAWRSILQSSSLAEPLCIEDLRPLIDQGVTLSEYAREQWERPDVREVANGMLGMRPLTKRLARQMMGPGDIGFAARTALRVGFPLAKGW